MVQGCHGREEAVDLVAAENGWKPLCSLGSPACQGLSGAGEELWREASQGAGTEAQGAWGEASAMVARQDVVWQWLCGDERR